jgi:heme/copper-type cytochrome/quinol oxidase subunit 1
MNACSSDSSVAFLTNRSVVYHHINDSLKILDISSILGPVNFIVTILNAAGAGEVVNTAIPPDFLTHARYFVVGHFHLFLMGTVTKMFTGFIYYPFAKIIGRMYNERAAQFSL